MSSTKSVQTNFSAGEVSSRLLGRIDHDRYKNGALRLENCIVTPQGTVSKRNGTKAIHAWNVNDENFSLSFGGASQNIRSEVYGARAIPVVFSREEAYVLILVKTTTGVNGYIYSNKNFELLKYQTNDDSVNVVNDVFQVQALTIPNWASNGTIALDPNEWYFSTDDPVWIGNNSQSHGTGFNFLGKGYSRIGYLRNRVTGKKYEFPGIPGSYIGVERNKRFRLGSTFEPHWWMVAKSGVGATPQWYYKTPDGTDNTFPLTNWAHDGGTGTNQTISLTQETTRFQVTNEITIGDGFSFDYSATELDEIDYEIHNDSVILVHPNHKPIVISRGDKRNPVAGVDDYRQWTAKVFPFLDGPYLESTQGKSLPGGADGLSSSDEVTLTLKKNSDVYVVTATDPNLIRNASNVSINDYVEFVNNGEILIGQVATLYGQNKGELTLNAIGPIASSVDSKAVIESDHITTGSIGMLFSDTAIWSRALEGSYFRHTQVDNSGTPYAVWLKLDKYVGQKSFTTDNNYPSLIANTVSTWQAPDSSGTYNQFPKHTAMSMDAFDVSQLTASVHFSIDDSTTGTVDSLSNDLRVFLKERVISYNVQCDSNVFHHTRDDGRWIRIELNGEKCWGRIYEVIVDSTATDWATSTSYVAGDWVIEDGKYYECLSNHTSGVFATDLSSGNWAQRYNASEVNVKLNIPPPIVRGGNESYTTNIWQFGAYHDASGTGDFDDKANYPSVVSSIDDRLFFGGGNLTPDLWHMSQAGDYVSFGPTDEFGEVLDTSSISYRLPTGAGTIKWAESSQNLIVGTTTGEYKISSSEGLVSLSPTNINVRLQTPFGSNSNSIVNNNGSIVFIQAPGKVIRELKYTFERDRYDSVNLSVVSEHLFNNADPVVEVSSINHPDNYLLFRTRRGRLICLTYEPENRVVAASPWSLSGLKPYSHETGQSGSYVTSDWITANEYLVGQTISYNGMYFQCVQKHTSDTFIKDYSESYWVHTGAPVVSMCSLPAKDDRSSDKFFFITFRTLTYEHPTNGYTTPTDSDFLCIETLEPINISKADSPYRNNVANTSFHSDFHLTIQDTQDGSFETPYFSSSPGQAYLDPADKETDLTATNTHLYKFIEKMAVVVGNTVRLPGFSVSVFGVKVEGVGGTPDRLHDLNNAFISQADNIMAIFDNRTAHRPDTPSVYEAFFFDDDSNLLYQYNESPIITGWNIGFTFPCLIKSLPFEFLGAPESGGGSLGRMKRANEVSLFVEDSGEFDLVGDSNYSYLSGEYQYSGVVDVSLDNNNNPRQDFTIASFSANRLNVLSYGLELDVNK